MRTIRVTLTSQLDATQEIKLETEILVDDQQDLREAGRDAFNVIREVTAGMNEAGK